MGNGFHGLALNCCPLLGSLNMTVQINVGGRDIPFRLNWEDRRWQSLEEQKESDFPLIAIVGDKRYELYSDETFAEVER